jgi:tRNA(Ile)-lysidine synthase
MDTGLALKRLEAYLDEKQLVSKGDKLVLGVSGGADSTALLYLFVQLRPKLDLSLLAVHVNHQLRAEESDADETAVKKLCLAWNVPLIVRKVKIGNQASLEDQARKASFKVFDEVMANYHYDKIALAHHREDQAETVLKTFYGDRESTDWQGSNHSLAS